jgi:hypothetical protein
MRAHHPSIMRFPTEAANADRIEPDAPPRARPGPQSARYRDFGKLNERPTPRASGNAAGLSGPFAQPGSKDDSPAP